MLLALALSPQSRCTDSTRLRVTYAAPCSCRTRAEHAMEPWAMLAQVRGGLPQLPNSAHTAQCTYALVMQKAEGNGRARTAGGMGMGAVCHSRAAHSRRATGAQPLVRSRSPPWHTASVSAQRARARAIVRTHTNGAHMAAWLQRYYATRVCSPRTANPQAVRAHIVHSCMPHSSSRSAGGASR